MDFRGKKALRDGGLSPAAMDVTDWALCCALKPLVKVPLKVPLFSSAFIDFFLVFRGMKLLVSLAPIEVLKKPCVFVFASYLTSGLT